MKLISLLCFFALTFHYQAQIVKTKDGVKLGKRSDFISACTQGADNKLMQINGLKIETEKYCTCVCDNLIPELDSKDMNNAMRENNLAKLFLEDENFEIILQCLEGNINIDDDYEYQLNENPELEKQIAIKACVKEILIEEELEEIWTKELAEEYCNCAVGKLLDSGLKYKDLLEIEDENSTGFNEIVVPCITETFNSNAEFQSSNAYIPEDIIGEARKSKVSLVDYMGKGYKLKINIDGVTKYFLFDTGASDLIIDRSIERELLINGTLKKENYLQKTEYTLANNEIVDGQMVKVDNITIGDYTLNNVIIAVVDEGSLLCGKSFLDKFKKWEIDKENNILILYK